MRGRRVVEQFEHRRAVISGGRREEQDLQWVLKPRVRPAVSGAVLATLALPMDKRDVGLGGDVPGDDERLYLKISARAMGMSQM